MATLRIPDQIRPGLLALIAMQSDSFESMLDALKRAPSSFTTKRELGNWLSSEVATILPADLEQIVDAITSLYQARERSGVPIPRFADDVTSSIGDSLPIADDPLVVQRLSSLLNLGSLNVVEVKAKELQMLDERLLLEARIITDLRPVFSEESISAPTAMIVVQSLKLRYYEPGTASSKEMYVAMDSKDISELKKILDRAQEKARSLKTALETAGIRIVDLDGGLS